MATIEVSHLSKTFRDTKRKSDVVLLTILILKWQKRVSLSARTQRMR